MTVTQALVWMTDPRPAKDLNSLEAWKCDKKENLPAPACSLPNSCAVPFKPPEANFSATRQVQCNAQRSATQWRRGWGKRLRGRPPTRDATQRCVDGGLPCSSQGRGRPPSPFRCVAGRVVGLPHRRRPMLAAEAKPVPRDKTSRSD